MNMAVYERSLHWTKNYNVIKKGFGNFDSWVSVCVRERANMGKRTADEKECFLKRTVFHLFNIKLCFKKYLRFYVLMQVAWIKKRVINSWEKLLVLKC